MAPLDPAYISDLAREAAFELIDGRLFHGRQTHAFYQLPEDYLQVGPPLQLHEDHFQDGHPLPEHEEPALASVALYTTGGNRGEWDRTDRLTVDVYAPGTEAVLVAEAVADLLVNDGDPHDLEAGYVDEFRVDVTPHDVPFPGGGVNQARVVLLVTHRPQ